MKLYIYEKRVEAGLSIRDLASRSKVAKSYIQKMEDSSAYANPTIRTICKIAKSLNVEPSSLFSCND